MSFLEDLGVSIGPAMNTFGQYYQMGLENQRQKKLDEQRRAIEEENRAIRMEQLKMEKSKYDRELKSMDLDDRRKAQDDAMREIALLEGRPAPDQMFPPDQGFGPTVQMPGQHPEIMVPRVGPGQAPIPVRPQTDIQVLAKAAAAAQRQRQMELAGEAAKRQLPPAVEGMVPLPPEMGGGQQPKSMAELTKTVYTEKQAAARQAAEIAARKEIEASKAGSPKPDEALKAARGSLTNVKSVLADIKAGKFKDSDFGLVGSGKKLLEEKVPGVTPNRERVLAQARVAGAAAAVRKDLSGVALSPTESVLIEPFAPNPGDKLDVVAQKLTGMAMASEAIIGSREANRTLTVEEINALTDKIMKEVGPPGQPGSAVSGVKTGTPKRLKFNPQTGMLE